VTFTGSLYALGYIRVFNRPQFSFLQGSLAVLILCLSFRLMPFPVKILEANIRYLDPSSIEAADLMMQGRTLAFRKVILPMLLPGVLIAWMVVFAFVLGEVDSVILLIPPGVEILSIKIYSLMHYGAGPVVAALSVMLVGMIIAVAVVVAAMARIVISGRLSQGLGDAR
jgi:ABC-type Fe3+ transport system permease subunit